MLAVAGLVAFVIRELKAGDPVVNLLVFKDRTFAMGTLLVTLMGFVLYGSLVMLPVLLQTLMGYPPLQAGLVMAPRGIGSLIAMPVVGLLVGKMDPRKLLAAGFLLGGFTLLWLSWLTLDAGFWDLAWPQFVQGIAFGLLFVPLTTVTMDHIPREEMGNATSLFSLMRNIGGSMGIATVQTLLLRDRQVHINALGSHVDGYSPQARMMVENLRGAFIARGADSVTATRRAFAAVFGMVQKQAAMISFIDAFRLLAVIFVVILPLVLLLRRPSHQRGPVVHSGE